MAWWMYALAVVLVLGGAALAAYGGFLADDATHSWTARRLTTATLAVRTALGVALMVVGLAIVAAGVLVAVWS